MRDDDGTPTGRGVSRRRLLGGVGAGAAALTIGGVATGASPASAAYYMKWGAVCSPPGDWATKVDRLRRMRPQTVRVSMFWGDPYNRRFADWQLDQLLGTGLNEMIIQSSEDPDSGLVSRQLDQVLPYIDAHPNILFVFEIGNEPDYHTDPYTARWKRLTALRDNLWSRARSNLYLAVNMPAGRWRNPNDPNFGYSSSGAYFDAFVRDAGDGLGGMFHGPYSPKIITAHCYSWDHLRRYPSRGEDNPYKMVDYVRGWSTSVNMKITEAGINIAGGTDRGSRYVEFGSSIANETAGQVDSVIFYGLPDVELSYSIQAAEADRIGTHP
ncbi:hypothetical protein [Micromonospora echinofusca]|uniref:Tat (Twin-arginine translocation) pathway signal sequence n=1 Tax=Micromonospora echinofusca TaxID=47858 RepID=A0ABS3VK96_MICEH|nr:hypothetical protein [Micromonospora echinofusca]MBO4204896.1 hypothetical protein [Micromonospora echinofusca]